MFSNLNGKRLGLIGVVAVVIGATVISPALGGPSLNKLVKKVVKKEVKKQLKRKKGRAGPAGPAGPAGASALAPVPSGQTIRGAVGGDFHAFDASASDFGVDVTLPMPAANNLSDGDVFVNVASWQNGGGQTAPTTTDTNAGCTGTPNAPVAPPGKVCIYVSGADHAFNVTGSSVLFGSEASPYGFKLRWDASTAGDTFVDATWAYRAP